MRNRSLLLAVVFIASSCGNPEGPPTPERPEHIPEDAAWIGGWDGGRWHRCEQIGELIECTQWVYEDFYASQKFKLCANANLSALPGFFSGFDFDRVEVKRGAIEMVSVEPQIVYHGAEIHEEFTEEKRR